MKIEIWSDFACPFCYIGKRRLEEALNEFEHKDKVEVIYKSFIIDPNAPKSTKLSGVEELAKSKGIPVEQARAMYNNVVKMAETVGLKYDLDKMQATSTKDAHALLQWAKTLGKDHLIVEKLYDGYFITGKNLADIDTLIDIAAEVGLDSIKSKEVIELALYEDTVINDIKQADELGIRSVPTFVFDRKFGVSGAQKKENFLQALNDAYKESNKLEINADDTACGIDGCDL